MYISLYIALLEEKTSKQVFPKLQFFERSLKKKWVNSFLPINKTAQLYSHSNGWMFNEAILVSINNFSIHVFFFFLDK